MAQDAHSWQNVSSSSVSPSLLEELASPPEKPVSPGGGTPTPSDVRLPNAPASDAPAPDAPVPVPAPAHYSKEDFQSMMKVCMDSILQAQVVCPTEPASHQEDQLKAMLPDFYYGKSHMKCYHFCQQCENHFDTADAIGFNRIPFATSFLCNQISFWWH